MSENLQSCRGGCACKRIRYRVAGAPMIVHACHCSWCQRQTGDPHVINALYEAEKIEVTQGEIENIDTPSPSGEGQLIARCPDCKVAVWSNYHFRGLKERVRFLRVGTLDKPEQMPPDVHIYTATKLPWYVIPPGHHAVDQFYDLETTWTPDNLERYRALHRAMAD